ncbi:MAG: LysR family transcriptional regulator [Acidocella sp.]|nr:LysR family transcriptional regulator [Acidocella sp.]
MQREEAGDLLAFMAVAQEGSFTRAAAKLATSQSALSHTVRRLETRLGLRLLARTTRSVALTEAGERLLRSIAPAFREIDSGVAALSELRDKPAGTVRITTSEHAAHAVLWPALAPLVRLYPDLHVELVIDSGMVDIVTERFDAGVRLGESVAKDMIAVRISPDLRMAVVGAPSYFAKHPKPKTPQDLAQHHCINLRLPTAGGLYVWELQKGARELHVRVDGQLIFNNPRMVVRAALDGMGLACVLEDLVTADIASGKLVRLLADWCPPFPGYHLYYPSRRQQSAGFALVVETLRHRT